MMKKEESCDRDKINIESSPDKYKIKKVEIDKINSIINKENQKRRKKLKWTINQKSTSHHMMIEQREANVKYSMEVISYLLLHVNKGRLILLCVLLLLLHTFTASNRIARCIKF